MKRIPLANIPSGQGVSTQDQINWIRDQIQKINLASRRDDGLQALQTQVAADEAKAAALYAHVTYDPPSLAAGICDAIQTLAVPGAALGNFVDASFSIDLQGMEIHSWVSAANTVSFEFKNLTSGTLNLGSGTVRFRVWTYIAP